MRDIEGVPKTPLWTGHPGEDRTFAYNFGKNWHEQIELAKALLHKAAKRMKKWADQGRRAVEFQVGEKVLVKLYPERKAIFRGHHRGLIRKYDGPFPIVQRIGKLAYRLDLPLSFQVHHVFHVCNLKPFNEDEEESEPQSASTSPLYNSGSFTRS